jgi:Phosphate starvation-inducible protein PhoH, predicted ATPase
VNNTIFFDNSETMRRVLGANDRNLSYLEMLLKTEILVRGNRIVIESEDSAVSSYFAHLIRLSASREDAFDESELFMEWQSVKESEMIGDLLSEKKESERLCIFANGKTVYPKSENQKRYIREIQSSQIVFGVGPAGTGKTYIACAYALSKLLSGEVKKIVLTRPVVEAGENLGFLPGDLSQKLNPYLKPFYDAMEVFISPVQIHRFEENGMIEIAPLAYMRGRSINNSVIILDEAQNTTKAQMKMFLTRLGENSSAIVTGDPSQIDLPGREKSGLVEALGLLGEIDGISIVEFSGTDCIRSRIVRAIIKAYEGDKDET